MCLCVMVVDCIEEPQTTTDVLLGCLWNVRAAVTPHGISYLSLRVTYIEGKVERNGQV